MKRVMQVLMVVGMLATFSSAQAELQFGYTNYSSPGYGSSYGGDPWAGMYGTGGYNLAGFGNSMYGVGNYLNSGYASGYGYGGGYGNYGTWGGSCSSIMTPCSGGYDSAKILVDVTITLPSYNYGSCGGGYSTCGSTCGGYSYSPCGNYNPCGSSCGGYSSCGGGSTCGGYGYNNYVYPTYLPIYPTYPSYPTYPTYPTYPSINPNTGTYVSVDVTTPPQLPPWGGCGGVVACPTTPTIPTTPVVPVAPTYNYQGQSVPVSPVRYTVPRGAH